MLRACKGPLNSRIGWAEAAMLMLIEQLKVSLIESTKSLWGVPILELGLLSMLITG